MWEVDTICHGGGFPVLVFAPTPSPPTCLRGPEGPWSTDPGFIKCKEEHKDQQWPLSLPCPSPGTTLSSCYG